MQTVNYQYSNNDNPTISTVEGIGVNDEMTGIVNGEYCGICSIDGIDYLVTKPKIAFRKTEEELKNTYDVRRSFVENSSDKSSGVLYVDQLQSEDCKKLEQLFSDSKWKEKNFYEIVNELGFDYPEKDYDIVTNTELINAISIRHDVFEKKAMTTEDTKTL